MLGSDKERPSSRVTGWVLRYRLNCLQQRGKDTKCLSMTYTISIQRIVATSSHDSIVDPPHPLLIHARTRSVTSSNFMFWDEIKSCGVGKRSRPKRSIGKSTKYQLNLVCSQEKNMEAFSSLVRQGSNHLTVERSEHRTSWRVNCEKRVNHRETPELALFYCMTYMI